MFRQMSITSSIFIVKFISRLHCPYHSRDAIITCGGKTWYSRTQPGRRRAKPWLSTVEVTCQWSIAAISRHPKTHRDRMRLAIQPIIASNLFFSFLGFVGPLPTLPIISVSMNFYAFDIFIGPCNKDYAIWAGDHAAWIKRRSPITSNS